MKPIVLVLPMMLALAACTTKTEYVYQYKPRPAVVEPQTLPVQMRKVEWKVITKPELEKLLADLNANPDPNFALFALTPKGFENLSYNLVEINRFMQEQQQVVLYYRKYNEETADTNIPVPATKPKAN
ncbi:hypothetical protein D3C87_770310 [compost metagenome]